MSAMRAWRLEEITDAGTLRLRQIEIPQPASDQHLVKVEAAGVAFGDTLLVRGKYQVKPRLPFTPGSDVVGRVVGGDADGQRIVGYSSQRGGFAEYMLVPKAEAVAIDEGMPAGIALALCSNFPTSMYALHHAAKLRIGETLLVHAAAGGVGSAALLLGKRAGARVIALAGGAEKVRFCRELGADEAIDYGTNNWIDAVRALAPDGIDVIYDPVGGEIGTQSMRVLAMGARYLVIGFASGQLTQLPANRLLLHNASAVGVLWSEVRKRDPALLKAVTAEIHSGFRDGSLRPPIGRGYAFDELPQALAALEHRKTIGKVWIELPTK